MQPDRAPSRETLCLARDVRLECDWEADHFALRTPVSAIPLNRIAASLLSLCDGRRTRGDLIKWFGRGDVTRSHDIAAFMDAAERRRWVTIERAT